MEPAALGPEPLDEREPEDHKPVAPIADAHVEPFDQEAARF
jgi:hypothetical protein